jgi:DNA primase
MDQDQITKLSFESFSKRAITDIQQNQFTAKSVEFKEIALPDNSRPLTDLDTQHLAYLQHRGISEKDYPFRVVDNETRTRIIIPYFYNGKIVGNTSRFYDNRQPKYLSEQQKGYVFNIDNQRVNWTTCILVEGQFDAISIGGCAYMGSTISDTQADLLKNLQREIIVVPDRDAAGLSICDRALELGYKVSIPNWADEIKDVNDAVRKYGKLPTLLSILQNATSSKIVVEIKRKKFK